MARKKQPFKPLKDNEVGMYNCGPTVYNYAHIGNFRAFICSDLLKRYLLYKGYKVKQVMNITDVDDKTIRDSKKEGLTLKKFTEKYTNAFLDDIKTLNISMPDIMPKATEHIDDMVGLIKKLMKKGYAYKARDGIYFNIAKFKKYGNLSRIDLSQVKQSARVKTDEYDKENARDFALWKFWDKEDGDVFWETPLGKGRPGWHIECSAMSTKYLGQSFDIHTGGIDLIFPHHENEIAQSESANGKTFVKFWLHNEYILVDGKKMSKSLGNFYTLRDLLAKGYKPKAIRYLLLSTSYGQQLNFTLKSLEAAEQSVARLQEFIDKLRRIKEKGEHNKSITKLIENTRIVFEEALDDDLNISESLAAIFEFIKEINKKEINKKDAEIILGFMRHIDKVLGILNFEEEKIPNDVLGLVEERERARKNRDYKKADEIRKLIKEKGYYIDDTKQGPIIKKT